MTPPTTTKRAKRKTPILRAKGDKINFLTSAAFCEKIRMV
jgi:hypothetical protein